MVEIGADVGPSPAGRFTKSRTPCLVSDAGRWRAQGATARQPGKLCTSVESFCRRKIGHL